MEKLTHRNRHVALRKAGQRLLIGLLILATAAIGAAQTPSQSTAQQAEAAQRIQAEARAEVFAVFGTPTREQQAQLARQARAYIQKAAKRALVERAIIEPTTGTTVGSTQQQLTVVADKGEVNGRARFSIPFGPNVDGQVTLTAPLTSGAAKFATEQGLTPNSSINGSIKWTIWNRKVGSPSQTEVANLLNPLKAVTAASDLPTSTDQLLANLEIARRSVAAAGPSSRIALAVAATSSSDLSRVVLSPTLAADPARYYAAVVQQMPTLTEVEWTGYITAAGESNRVSIDYLTEETFESKTFDDTAGVFSLSAGTSKMGIFEKSVEGQDAETEKIKKPLFFAGTSFRAGDSVTAADPQNICRPIGEAGAVDCVEGPVGGPLRASTVSWTAELRFWSWGSLQSVGFNPRYTYSRQRPDSGNARTTSTIEVPIYFMHQVKDVTAPSLTFGADLVGGVSVGWRQTKTGEKTQEGAFVTLFLTKAFELP